MLSVYCWIIFYLIGIKKIYEIGIKFVKRLTKMTRKREYERMHVIYI